MKRFFILFLMFALSVPVMGRKHPDVPQAYAYGSSIDIQGGFVGMPYSISGDAGKAFGIDDGGEFQLRYSYFFRRHWGIFTSFSLLGTGVDDIDYFGTVNKADGGRYRYGSAPYELNCVGAGSNPYGRNNGFFGAAFQESGRTRQLGRIRRPVGTRKQICRRYGLRDQHHCKTSVQLP